VQSIDELLIAVKPSMNLRFDEKLPGFHLYAADLCTQATESNYHSYVIHAPVIHNSKRHKSLGGSYASAYRYLQKKWRFKLPIITSCSPITKWGISFARIRFGLFYRRILGRLPDTTSGSIDAVSKASELGYE